MTRQLYLRPVALTARSDGLDASRRLAGGQRCFDRCDVTLRAGDAPPESAVLDLDAADDWITVRDRSSEGLSEKLKDRLVKLAEPRPDFAGLSMDRPHIMGIVNVTPDSFSDGGDRLDAGKAIADGLAMWEAGATILDIGGESTRPGAEPVSEEEETARVVPVIRGLSEAGARVSIDTRHARVMRAAFDAGAQIVNDVTALEGDPASLAFVADAGLPVVLMHMQGEPRSMQKNPTYDDVTLDVFDYLERRVEVCLRAGISRSNIAVDVGIGFGKTIEHNLALLDRLALFHAIGVPLLLGLSRKSFIAKLSRGEAPKDRLAGSLAGVAAGLARGVQLYRVHDVAETSQMIALWRAIEKSP